jgi:hypothetical protein
MTTEDRYVGISPQEIRALFPLRNQAIVHVLQFFSDAHLHKDLLEIAVPIRILAFDLTRLMMDGPELAIALRRILDARDAFIRHYLITHNFKLDKED